MKNSFGTSQKESISGKIRSYLYRECELVVAAYLFGSFVTDDSFSDIDLAILMDTMPRNTVNLELEVECKLEEIIKFRVDVRIINGAPLSFCQNVIRHGRVIVDKDPDFRAEFEGNILKQYFDFSHFRRRYLDEIRNAPV